LFELFQADLTTYLQHTTGYLEHAYQSYNIVFTGNNINIDTTFLDIPTTLSGSPSATVLNGESYAYKISAITDFGETPVSNSIVVISGGTDLSANNINLGWGAVTGASHYNVYGRTVGGTLALLDSVETNSYTDVGITALTRTLPATNTAVKTFRYQLGDERAYVSIPTLSGYTTSQVLTEQTHYEVEDLHKIKFLQNLHKVKFDVTQEVSGDSFIINNVKGRSITLKRGVRYVFVLTTIDNFALTSVGSNLTTPGTSTTVDYTPTALTPDTIYYNNPSGSLAISVVDDISNVIFYRAEQEPLQAGEKFLALSGYSLLPSLFSIYFPGFGADTPEDVVLNNHYQPYASGYATGALTYTQKRLAYATHLKNWSYAYSSKLRSSPTVSNLEAAYSLVKGLPFVYESGVISSITNISNYNYVDVLLSDNTTQTYEITDSLLLNIVDGQSVSKFDVICSGISLVDYLIDEYTVSGYMTKTGSVLEFDVGIDHINELGVTPKFIEKLDLTVRSKNLDGEF
jgi:hypothetical protein